MAVHNRLNDSTSTTSIGWVSILIGLVIEIFTFSSCNTYYIILSSCNGVLLDFAYVVCFCVWI